MNIIDIIKDDIQSGHDGRNQDHTPTLKTLLSVYAFMLQRVPIRLSGNLHGMRTSAAHNAIHYVARAIARCKGNYIFSQEEKNLARLKRYFLTLVISHL